MPAPFIQRHGVLGSLGYTSECHWVSVVCVMIDPPGIPNQRVPFEKPRFIADAMLGKLARWLRLLGYDTLYSDEEDAVIAQRARSEDRVLLTRDRGLAERRGLKVILITSTVLDQQMAEVNTVIPIPPGIPRCMSCNRLLQSISPEVARLHVPPYVAASHAEFHQCPECGRIFWSGTHWTNIRERLHRIGARNWVSTGDSDAG